MRASRGQGKPCPYGEGTQAESLSHPEQGKDCPPKGGRYIKMRGKRVDGYRKEPI